MYIHTYIYIYNHTYLFIYLFIYSFIYLFIHLFIYVFMYLYSQNVRGKESDMTALNISCQHAVWGGVATLGSYKLPTPQFSLNRVIGHHQSEGSYSAMVKKKITWTCLQMDVSKNSGTPKSSILIGFSIINHPFWGTPIFGNIHMLA